MYARLLRLPESGSTAALELPESNAAGVLLCETGPWSRGQQHEALRLLEGPVLRRVGRGSEDWPLSTPTFH